MIAKLRKLALATALVLGTCALASTAFAQPPAQQNAPQQSSSAAAAAATGPAPTNTELKQFAQAAVGIANVEKTAKPKIQSAKNKADRTKLVKAANQKIKTVINNQHLTLHRYEQIAEVVETNKTVRAKVLKMIKVPAKS